jgi:hypothetical protein
MKQEDKPTYNKLNFAQMAQALKSNISRRKQAKNCSLQQEPESLESQTSKLETFEQ